MRTLFRLLITAVLTAAVLAAVILLRLPVQTLQIATVPLINIAASAGLALFFWFAVSPSVCRFFGGI